MRREVEDTREYYPGWTLGPTIVDHLAGMSGWFDSDPSTEEPGSHGRHDQHGRRRMGSCAGCGAALELIGAAGVVEVLFHRRAAIRP
jgi:hypothetical protein